MRPPGSGRITSVRGFAYIITVGAALLGLAAATTLGCADVGSAFPDAEVAGGVDSAVASDAGVDVGSAVPDAPPGVDLPPLVADEGARPPDPGAPPSDDGPAPPDEGPNTDLLTLPDTASPLDEGPPPTDASCTPCHSDEDCPPDEACTSYGSEGSFCGEGCEEFACTPETEGMSTTCASGNEHGVCEGSRECVAQQLLACSAAEPAPDLCDGLDNDCDGEVDPGALDTDGDDVPDCIDPDDDGDGIADGLDSCPLVPNPSQTDLDEDGLGDVCDADIDGDGSPNSVDCAPEDPELSSPSIEVCNGKDDDCDQLIDEQDALGCTNYYPDDDEDGWGAQGQAKCLCVPDDVHFLNTGKDCDDSTKFVSPSAPEACDLLDNDCDQLIDEEGALGCKDWYYDSDGDTWYAPGAGFACLCFPAPQQLWTGKLEGDCDDGNPKVNPGAAEACDGGDDNCDENADEGCDDDQDGFCDAQLVYKATGGATCFFGGGDCDDGDATVHPGALELCDGKDTNCTPNDDVNEGTIEACGDSCAPCPPAPPGAQYSCTGVGPGTGCELTCSAGTFCSDCTCDGQDVLELGAEVKDGQLLYDSALDTFRLAYAKTGAFRLRAFGPTGILGNDVIAVGNVDKWTNWGVTQMSTNGQFVFAWTSYPDSSVRVGIASQNGTSVAQYTVAQDLLGALSRQNVTIGWNVKSKTMLVLWDETTELDLDIRGVLLDATTAPLSAPFQIVGGVGSQSGATMRPRAEDKGYVFAYMSQVGQLSPPKLRFVNHSAGGGVSFELQPNGKSQTTPSNWYSPTLQRGIVQWLGTDDKYHVRMYGELGPMGDPIDLGVPIGAMAAAPQKNTLRLFYMSGGEVQMRSVTGGTGSLLPATDTVSEASPVTKIVGAATHPLDYALVIWNVAGQLRGRLIAP